MLDEDHYNSRICLETQIVAPIANTKKNYKMMHKIEKSGRHIHWHRQTDAGKMLWIKDVGGFRRAKVLKIFSWQLKTTQIHTTMTECNYDVVSLSDSAFGVMFPLIQQYNVYRTQLYSLNFPDMFLYISRNWWVYERTLSKWRNLWWYD